VASARSISASQEKSVQQFLERQARAKEKKQVKDVVFEKHDGSKWKNEVTKPQPPKITDIII
jgi:carbamate kinase